MAREKRSAPVMVGEEAVSGLGRRAGAFIIDVVLATSVALLLSSVVGLVLPMDDKVMFFIMLFLGLLVIVYVAAAPCQLHNSVGKMLTGIKVVDAASGARPSGRQCLFRGLLLPLWPVEGLVVLFSKGKQRLGDRLAKTAVVLDSGVRFKWYLRLVMALVALVVPFGLATAAMGVASRQTHLCRAATAFVQQHVVGCAVYGSPGGVGFLPRQVMMFKNYGRVVLSLEGAGSSRFALLLLVRSNGGWRVHDWRLVSEGGGYSYSYHY